MSAYSPISSKSTLDFWSCPANKNTDTQMVVKTVLAPSLADTTNLVLQFEAADAV